MALPSVRFLSWMDFRPNADRHHRHFAQWGLIQLMFGLRAGAVALPVAHSIDVTVHIFRVNGPTVVEFL